MKYMTGLRRKISELVVLVMLVVSIMNHFPAKGYAATGDLNEGYHVSNLSKVFNRVDGGTVSTNSDGIVTILVFARTNGNCPNSNNTVKSLCNSGWISDERVRLIVVDIDKSSVDTVLGMKEDNKDSTAIFCYDQSNTANNAMWTYLHNTIGGSDNVTLPVTVIIDSNNMVQYCLTGNQNAGTIYKYVVNLVGDELTDGTYKNLDIYVEGTYDEQKAYEVLQQVNVVRQQNGLAPLKMDKTLMDKAMERAAECSVYFGHTRPNGQDCFTVLSSKYKSNCGENIAAGQMTSQAVMEAWLNSPGHYANIMGNYTNIGIGCFYQDGGIHWVQLFSGYGSQEKTDYSNYIKKTVIQANSEYLGEFSVKYDTELEVGDTGTPVLKIRNLKYRPVTPSKDNIVFSSSDSTVVSVDKDGTIHALADGEATITATIAGVVTARCTIVVGNAEKPPTGEDGNQTTGLIDIYVEGTLDEEKAFALLEGYNEARKEKGLTAFTMDKTLMEYAMKRAVECAVTYQNTRPDGSDFWSSLNSRYSSADLGYTIMRGYDSAEELLMSTKDSSSYKYTILDSHYTHIGIGCFHQSGEVYWVMLFSNYGEEEKVLEQWIDQMIEVRTDVKYLNSLTLTCDKDFFVGDEADLELKLGNGLILCNANVDFISSDSSIVSVDEYGTAYALGAGQVTIRAVLDEVLEIEENVVALDPAVMNKGDVDYNGLVDLMDAQITLKAALKIISFKDANSFDLADVNGDGMITLRDAQKILKAALRIEAL